MTAVTSGRGPAYNSQVPSPAPWGVTDGPYSRHYAKWLIPDSAFGDDVSNDYHPQSGGKGLTDRATRNSQSGKSRVQRGSNREKLQSLPHGYPEIREDKGPITVQRSTDGKMVKLVCLDCRREDFNSAQGFVNHCRIAHSRNFASHDAAAIACGEEVDGNATPIAVGGNNTPNNPNTSLVHPLIRTAHLANSAPTTSPVPDHRRKKARVNHPGQSRMPGNVDGAEEMPSTPVAGPSAQLETQSPSPFKPSPQTPHLSALWQKNGFGGDLSEMVTEAKKKPDPELMAEDVDDSDEEMETPVAQPANQQSTGTQGTLGIIRGGGRLPAHSRMSPAPLERSPSSKRRQSTTQRRPENINTDAMLYHDSSLPETSHDMHQHKLNTTPPATSPVPELSPNTIESHPAPSLVSDDGEYDNTHSESETPSSAAASDDEDTLEVEVKDPEQHAMDLDTPCSSSATGDYSIGKAHHHPPPPTRRRPSRQQHVTFDQPGPRTRGGARKKGGR